MSACPRTAGRAAIIIGIAAIVLSGLSAAPLAQAGGPDGDPLIERGRYLVLVSGCNDCHTAGFIEADGNIPESEWLGGNALGWHGPWGTTYPTNLRLYFEDMTEEQWLQIARQLRSRPPMPWFTLREMTDEDLRAIFRFTRSLGDPGEPAPAYQPPGEEPAGAHFRLVPPHVD